MELICNRTFTPGINVCSIGLALSQTKITTTVRLLCFSSSSAIVVCGAYGCCDLITVVVPIFFLGQSELMCNPVGEKLAPILHFLSLYDMMHLMKFRVLSS
jgi:hypothetical protein